VEEVLAAIRSQGGIAEMIGEITNADEEIFTYGDQTIAVIPNHPSAELLASLS
jgi:hypothetical protein